VERFTVPVEPVEDSDLSTAAVHRQNGSVAGGEVVFPGVHTPYCYYELF
jgi:hypothetical protein